MRKKCNERSGRQYVVLYICTVMNFSIFYSRHILLDYKIKEGELGGACSTHGNKEECI
jgi:hypothetical protein